MRELIVTGTVALAVGVAPTELETVVLPLDEEVEVELAVEVASARFSNCPGCHIEGAHSSDALTVRIREKAVTQKTKCRDQDVPWGDFMAVGEIDEV